MRITVERKDLDVSEQSTERSEMSSLGEMHCLVHEAADFAAPNGNWKERVQAAARSFGLGWERAKAFYYRDARRVEAEEMDRARRAIRKLRQEARDQRHREHLEWLASEIGRLEASGEEFHGPHVDGLKHFLRVAGRADGAVAIPAEDPFDFSD